MKRQCAAVVSIAFWGIFGGTAIGDDSSIAAKPAADRAPSDGLFDRLDANHDGEVAGDEVPAERQELFRRLLEKSDANRNGTLDRGEFAAGLASKLPGRPLTEPVPDGPAGGQMPDPKKLFERLDRNGDGKIVADEVPDEARGRFEKLAARADKDGDGALTEAEVIAAFSPPKGPPAGKAGQLDAAKLLEYFDRNADGKLTKDEIPSGRPMLERIIDRADKDGDGGVSEEELKAAVEVIRRFQLSQQTSASPAKPAKKERPRLSAADRSARAFAKLDADHDGKVTEAEYSAQLKQRFERLDTNADGYIDAAELAAGGKKTAKSTAARNRPAKPTENNAGPSENNAGMDDAFEAATDPGVKP